MIKKVNYNKISSKAVTQLKLLIQTLFPQSNFKRIKLRNDGNVLLLRSGLPFFRNGVSVHISQLLFDEIPRAISIELYNSTDFTHYLREKIITNLDEKVFGLSEIARIEGIIDFLHSEAMRWKLFIPKEDIQIMAMPLLNKDKVINIEAEESDYLPVRRVDNIFYIFNHMVNEIVRNSAKYARVTMFVMALELFKVLHAPIVVQVATKYKPYMTSLVTPFKMCIFNTS